MPAATDARLIAGRYRLGTQLGAGGMGRVYAAEDITNGDLVAVKLLRHLPDAGWERREDVRAWRALAHPHVVKMLDAGVEDGSPFVVMERLRGVSLGAEIRQHGALSLRRVLELGLQVLTGVAAIHRAGLVHGDMKSDNVLVDTDGAERATIIDLTIAPPANADHTFTGTPEYIAPEVITGEPPTPASDIYGIGIMLYEMISATTPFAGGAASEIFERHLNEPPTPLSQRCPERRLPSALEALIARSLEKAAGSRPRNADAFAYDLRRALPATYEHDDSTPPRFSTQSTTRDWQRPTVEPTSPWRRRP